MNNAPAILRSLVIYAVIVPLAVFIGYLLSDPLERSSFTYYGILVLILISPILLRWHHPLLIFSWNSGMYLFFVPGQPALWLAMTAASLGITLLQRSLGGVKHLLSVPQVTWSLLFMIGVEVLTARLTGMGLHAFGSEISGGRRYIYMLGSILSYFALSSRRIPPERAGVCVALFCLSGLTGIVTDLWPIMVGPLRYIYLFFPASAHAASVTDMESTMRFEGAWAASLALYSYMVAKYGLRGIFLSGKSWRWMVFFLSPAYLLFGGFRGYILFFALLFALQFYIEGLHRTKLLPIFAFIGISMLALLVPLASHLPGAVQRALAFLPVQINRQVQQEADQSLDWRLVMWKSLLPQIPHYLLLGKGYAWSRLDLELLTGSDAAIKGTFAEDQPMALSGSYHNGPLSVVMTFGIWGVIALVWFWIAGIWVLYNNYRRGDPALRTVNTFLLVAFVGRIIYFMSIFGDIGYDIQIFGGFLGLSVSLNGGVSRHTPPPVRETGKFQAFDDIRSHLQPTFRRPKIRA
jgi:hypothetical protein